MTSHHHLRCPPSAHHNQPLVAPERTDTPQEAPFTITTVSMCAVEFVGLNSFGPQFGAGPQHSVLSLLVAQKVFTQLTSTTQTGPAGLLCV